MPRRFVIRIAFAAFLATVLGCNPSADRTPTGPTAFGPAPPPTPTNSASRETNAVSWACVAGDADQPVSSSGGWTIERAACLSTSQRIATTAVTVGPIFAPAPTNLRATVNATTVQLNWDQPPVAYAWQLEVVPTAGFPNLAVFRTTAGTSLTLTGVPSGVYFVRVRSAAPDFSDLSLPSNEIAVAVGNACHAPPGAPSGLRASVVGNHVSLGWNPPPGGASTSYVLEVGSASLLSDVLVFDTGSASTSLQGTAATAVYFARVRAKNACGTGGPSNEIPVSVGGALPPPPVAAFFPAGTVAIDGFHPVCSYRGCGFVATSSTGTRLSYAWDFGDGTTGSGPLITHTYARPDRPRQFTVLLTVTDAFGRTDTTARNIYLHPSY